MLYLLSMIADILSLIVPLAFNTGEYIIYIITPGRKKPCWDLNKEGKKGKFFPLNTPSMWIGLLFWTIIIFARLVLSIIAS